MIRDHSSKCFVNVFDDLYSANNQTRVALAMFGNEAQLVFGLNNLTLQNDKVKMRAAIDRAQHKKENTNTYAGLQMLRKEVSTK